MLSYRHAFHAGNHADVLKHFVLAEVLAYATQKEKVLYYIDTHAGAGLYALNSGYATKNSEYIDGFMRITNQDNAPKDVQNFINLILSFNAESKLSTYPGSPAIATQLLRQDDKLRLFELHPNDFDLLEQACAELLPNQIKKQGKVIVQKTDGFAGIKALLPPPSRRAVVLIDPPYEQKQDYQRVVEMIKDCLKRFETGTYILWYPCLQRPEPQEMIQKLKLLGAKNWLHVTLNVQSPSDEGFGMFGSGLFIINPPWTLPKKLAEAMPYLVDKLGLDEGANYSLDYQLV